MAETCDVVRARPVRPVPTLRMIEGRDSGTVLRLDREEGTLGRRKANHYVLAEPSVGRVHARITREAGAVIVTDLGSSGGTQINGTPVVGSAVAAHGDRIRFGSLTMVLEDPAMIDTGENPTEILEPPPVRAGPGLSPRQLHVLEGIAAGQTNSEIGTVLGITERTVKAYTSELYHKLGVPNRAGAVARALQDGLL